MKKYLILLATALPLTIFFSCHRLDAPKPEVGGDVYPDLPEKNDAYFGSSVFANAQATLGRVLFYERQLSINNSVSCGSCHKQAFAFADNAAGSAGFENRITGRNTPPLQNLGINVFNAGGATFTGGGPLFWDGREQDMQKLITRPISNHVEMGLTDMDEMVARVKALPYYKKLFLDAFGKEDINKEGISKAIAVFVCAINAVNTRFDKVNALNALELEGMQLFNQKYDCANCHKEDISGYSNMALPFRNIGLDAASKDLGRAVISGNSNDNGKFKVPNLRNVVLTAPYMHDGRFNTLSEVLDHYSHNIKDDPNLDAALKDPSTGGPMRMNISKHEKDAIIAFLGALTDYEMVTNPIYSDPFKLR